MPSEPGLSLGEKDMLDRIPPDGTSIGNGRLRALLNWDIDKYWDIRRALVNKALVQLGRGRGGSVSRVAPSPGKTPPTHPVSIVKEKDLYPTFHKALVTWAKDQGWTDHFVEHQAASGKKAGMWTRPDFVVVGHKKYEYTPGVVRDIETFEVKTADFSVDAVFETASHSRFATKSYLAVAKAPGDDEIDSQLLSRAESECQRFGIGLLLFPVCEDPNTWEWRLDAVRKEPDPEEVERYIDRQFDSEHKKQIRGWF